MPLFLLPLRTYRGYSVSQNAPDVTMENNLSRVITAVSHALVASTSRALTVSRSPTRVIKPLLGLRH